MIYLLLIAFSALSFIVIQTIMIGISPMPSHRKVKKILASLFRNQSYPVIMDLGSGWGQIASFLATIQPKSRVIGMEKSFIPWLYSLCRKRSNLQFLRKDFLQSLLLQPDFIYLYLFPKAMHLLEKKLLQELKKPVTVVSFVFAFPSIKPHKVYVIDDLHRSKLYLYKIKPHSL